VPLYEYECAACGKRFEVIQKFSDEPPAACRVCGSGPSHRQASSPAIQFKGSGFYITDYAKKASPDADASGSAAKGGETKSADTKGDAASKSDGGTRSETGTKSESAPRSDGGDKSESSTPKSESAPIAASKPQVTS
jgi:putative FmdB family regulatory protein